MLERGKVGELDVGIAVIGFKVGKFEGESVGLKVRGISVLGVAVLGKDVLGTEVEGNDEGLKVGVIVTGDKLGCDDVGIGNDVGPLEGEAKVGKDVLGDLLGACDEGTEEVGKNEGRLEG